MADEKGRGEANRGDTHAAPMVDDSEMSTQDANETAGSESGIGHAPIARPGQVGAAAGGYTVLAGSGVAGGADVYPVDLDPTADADTTGNDVDPAQRGLNPGRDQSR